MVKDAQTFSNEIIYRSVAGDKSNQFTVSKFRTTIRVNKPPYKASNSCQANINCRKEEDKLVN